MRLCYSCIKKNYKDMDFEKEFEKVNDYQIGFCEGCKQEDVVIWEI